MTARNVRARNIYARHVCNASNIIDANSVKNTYELLFSSQAALLLGSTVFLLYKYCTQTPSVMLPAIPTTSKPEIPTILKLPATTSQLTFGSPGPLPPMAAPGIVGHAPPVVPPVVPITPPKTKTTMKRISQWVNTAKPKWELKEQTVPITELDYEGTLGMSPMSGGMMGTTRMGTMGTMNTMNTFSSHNGGINATPLPTNSRVASSPVPNGGGRLVSMPDMTVGSSPIPTMPRLAGTVGSSPIPTMPRLADAGGTEISNQASIAVFQGQPARP